MFEFGLARQAARVCVWFPGDRDLGVPPPRGARRGRSSSGLAHSRSVAPRLRRCAPHPPSDLARVGRAWWWDRALWLVLRRPLAVGAVPRSGSVTVRTSKTHTAETRTAGTHTPGMHGG